MAINVFISYARGDEGHLYALYDHLAGLRHDKSITTWSSRMIGPDLGDFRREVDPSLETSQIVILLITARYLASPWCYSVEVARAFEMLRAGRVWVVPVIVESCDWRGTEIQGLTKAPDGGKPVTTWPDQNRAWMNVACQVRAIVEQKLGRPLSTRPPGSSKPPSDQYHQAPPSAEGSLYWGQAHEPLRATMQSFTGGYVAEARAPSNPTIHSRVTLPSPAPSPRKERGPWGWVLGACGAFFFLLAATVTAIVSTTYEPPKEDPSLKIPGIGGGSGPRREEAACCGGADCAPARRDVRGSYCERNPSQCQQCQSGRRLVEGACREPLSPGRVVRLRLSHVEQNGARVSPGEVCIRREGDPMSATHCEVTGSGGSFGSLSVPVGDLLEGGRGLHVQVKKSGFAVAERRSAVIQGRELASTSLCVGVMLRVNDANVFVFLDD